MASRSAFFRKFIESLTIRTKAAQIGVGVE
jgi:hypothetical protein